MQTRNQAVLVGPRPSHTPTVSFLCRESNKAVLFKRIKCLIVRQQPNARRRLAAPPPRPLGYWRNCVTLGIINCEYCSPLSSSWLQDDQKLESGGSFGFKRQIISE